VQDPNAAALQANPFLAALQTRTQPGNPALTDLLNRLRGQQQQQQQQRFQQLMRYLRLS
jgi:hypothetical protein